MNDDLQNTRFENIRVDFETEVIESDKESRRVKLAMYPDPRRYDHVSIDGEKYYIDKFLGYKIDTITLESMAKQAVGLPGYYLPSNIKSSIEYSDARRRAIEHEMSTGEYVAPTEAAEKNKKLKIDESLNNITFISVDICNSSSLRKKNGAKFDLSYKYFLQELGTVVGQFHGSIHKTTGDGFIAFLDHPSINSQCDAVIDMCLTLLFILDDSLNILLTKNNLPQLNIRIGADHGPASLQTFTVPTTGFTSEDVVSDALNLAVKIQESAEENQFRIGRNLYERIHVQWLERANEVETLSENEVGVSEYRLYSVQ